MGGEIAPLKHTRASTSKSRTGCVTCKARRVKCDEGKPSCNRCTSGGRKCEGYGSLQIQAKARSRFFIYTPPFQHSQLHVASSSEIDFYHHRVASSLSGYFDLDFWHVLIMQLSQSEEAIRHAITAISAVHRNLELERSAASCSEKRSNTIILKETTAAMRSLTNKITTDPNERLVPLVACILFTCLEFLQGSVESAMVHMISGFKILNTARALGVNETSPQISDVRALEKHVVPVFSRLNFLCTLFGREMPPMYMALPQGEFHLHTLPEARTSLYEIMDAALRFIREADPLVMSLEEDQFDKLRKAALENLLEQWFDAFERLDKHASSTGHPLNETAANLLRIQHRVMYLWLVVSITRQESIMDSLTVHFEAILDYATQITSGVGPGKSQPRLEDFSFEMQIIPPLYYVAIKCRVPSLRRRAIALLQLAPRREGLWNAHLAIKVAECVIEIEEAGLPVHFSGLINGCSNNDELRLKAEILPTEEARVHGLSVLPGHVAPAHDLVKCSNQNARNSKPLTVTFVTMPDGLNGKRHRIERTFFL